MKSFLKLFCLLAAIHTTSYSFGWGTTGHRIIAEIAERNLSRKAKKEIKKIIGNQKLAYWANWPDFIKSDKNFKYADSWHYVNIPGNLPFETFVTELKNSSEENLYKRIFILADDLKKGNLSTEKKQQCLYFLIHILGDAHQPLHIGRADDLGGNKITVEWFGERTNIHTVWDSKLVDYEKYSYTEYADVLNVLSKKQIRAIQEGTPETWLFDSYTISNAIYDGVKNGDHLKYGYPYLHKQHVEQQLLKGGLRLSKVLNEIFK